MDSNPRLPLSALAAIPFAAAAMAYVTDVIVGTQTLVSPFFGGIGVERWGVVTAIVCAIEALVVVAIYLRAKRYTHAAGMLVYLVVVAVVMLWFATFRR